MTRRDAASAPRVLTLRRQVMLDASEATRLENSLRESLSTSAFVRLVAWSCYFAPFS